MRAPPADKFGEGFVVCQLWHALRRSRVAIEALRAVATRVAVYPCDRGPPRLSTVSAEERRVHPLDWANRSIRSLAKAELASYSPGWLFRFPDGPASELPRFAQDTGVTALDASVLPRLADLCV